MSTSANLPAASKSVLLPAKAIIQLLFAFCWSYVIQVFAPAKDVLDVISYTIIAARAPR